MTLYGTVIENLSLVCQKTLEHLFLAGFSTLLAISVGIPLGILLSKRKHLKKPIMGAVNILQTIPSIALLACLLPFLGIGFKPALITLALYALLPIVRNTLTGLEGVPEELVEAADGIGFTPNQKLWMVEIPIALPVIIGGVRTAAVMSVGIATVAAFVGAGGLGDFIFQGITTGHTDLVLLGAIPAAMLALVMDMSFGWLEKSYSLGAHTEKQPSRWKPVALAFVAILVVVGSQASPRHSAHKPGKSVVIASKDFTEQLIIGEMVAQLLEDKGDFNVIRKFNLGTIEVCHQAMVRGDVDIYPEYTGSASLVVLDQNPNGMTSDELFRQVKKEYADRFAITWMDPLGFENVQTIAVRKDFAEKNQICGIRDLCGLADPLRIGAHPEFTVRTDGYSLLQNSYSLDFSEVRSMSSALLYQAIADGQVDLIMAFSTDGRLDAYGLKPLEDQQSVFPHYSAAILVKNKILEDNPGIQETISSLSGSIDEKTMRRMNHAVEVEMESPAKVARHFLLEKGFLSESNGITATR